MANALHFGHFEIRLDQRQLLVDGQPATLGSRAFDVLRALAERRERLVSKEELLELVWPGMIVEENNLQVQVSALRKLLGTQVIATIPGRGYQFTAALSATQASAPVVPSVPTATTHAAAPAPARHVASPRGHLLVAEDNKVNRLLLCRTLELMGHQVASVDNGRKALDALRRERHDLLLLDLEMPELDGLALLEELARDPELRDLPVIVTSSVEGVAQMARCIELGADDYLHKPVNPVLLKARVASSLDKRRLREQQKELIQRLTAAAAMPGTAGTAGATGAQRTAATVLAVRLREIASTTAAQGALEVIELLDGCHTLWRDAIASHGGVAFDSGGEGLLAVFGAVPTSTSSALAPTAAAPAAEARLAATRAALEMAEMLEVLTAERAGAGRPALAIHVGVASGEVVVGHAGVPPQARLHCIGEPVRLAIALSAHALSCEHTLLVDAPTQSALRGRVATEELPHKPPLGPGGAAVAVYCAKTG